MVGPLHPDPDVDPGHVMLYWHGDHTACSRFFVTELIKPKRCHPIELWGRPGQGYPAVKLESECEVCGGFANRSEAKVWASQVGYQLEKL
jgi:hypothetical protein